MSFEVFSIPQIEMPARCVHCGSPIVVKVTVVPVHYETDGPQLLIGLGSECGDQPDNSDNDRDIDCRRDLGNFHCPSCGIAYEFPPGMTRDAAIDFVRAEIKRLEVAERSRRLEIRQKRWAEEAKANVANGSPNIWDYLKTLPVYKDENEEFRYKGESI